MRWCSRPGRFPTYIAVTGVYGHLPGFSCGTGAATPAEIGEGYYRAEAPVIRSQLQHAGVRLAKILNDVFR